MTGPTTGQRVAAMLDDTAAWMADGRKGLPPSIAALPDDERAPVMAALTELADVVDDLERRRTAT